MTPEQQKVLEFHRTFDLLIEVMPKIPLQEEMSLRVDLIQEELDELREAFRESNITKVADALGDLLYVVYGTAISCGLDMAPVFDEIHRSNMTKVGGHKASNGKWVKPATYEPARIADVMKPLLSE